MVTSAKRKILLFAAAAVLALAVCLAFVLPTDDRLIATPSTHDNIHYLPIDSPRLDGNRTLRFAAYDADCGVVQLCFSVRRGDRAFWQGRDIAMTINGEAVDEWSHFTDSTWKRDYFHILIDEVQPDAQITFTYGGQTITIG